MACFRKFAGAGELANVGVFGVGDDFAFFAVAERADDAARIFLVRYHRRHAAEFAFVQHVHQKRFDNVVHVVAERNFVEVVFACELDEFRATLRAAPIAIQLAAFLEAGLYGDVLKVEWHLRVFFCHALQEFAGRLVCKIALDVDGGEFALGAKFAEACGEFHQEDAGILATACSDEHAVSIFNQVEVVNGFRDFLIDSFAYLTRHNYFIQNVRRFLLRAAFSIKVRGTSLCRYIPIKLGTVSLALTVLIPGTVPFAYTVPRNKKGSLSRALKFVRTAVSCPSGASASTRTRSSSFRQPVR